MAEQQAWVEGMEQVTDAGKALQVEAGLAKVRARFISMLEDRADELYDLLEYLDDPNVRDLAYREIQARAHKLHGISASVGFPRIGDLAANLEESVDLVRSGNKPQNLHHVRRNLDALLKEMERSLNDA